MRALRNDDGAAAVLVAVAAGVTLAACVVVAAIASSVQLRHHLAATADASALAAASRVEAGPAQACGVAAEVAQRDAARLVACRVEGPLVTVAVTRARAGLLRWLTPPTLNSRAGPAETKQEDAGQADPSS